MQVSDHAIRRYRERVSPVDDDTARAAMMAHERAVRIAAEFGCATVKLGNGVRLKLKGDVVTTVFGNGKGDGRESGAFFEDDVPSPSHAARGPRPLPAGEREEGGRAWR